MMRSEEHPVKVVYALAVQYLAAGIVFREDMRPFRIIGRVAIIAVADIAIIERQATRGLIVEDDGALIMDGSAHAGTVHGEKTGEIRPRARR